MKRILFFAAVLAALILGKDLFEATDVAKLQPVEVIRIRCDGGRLLVETDTAQQGWGGSLEEAFRDLKESASGDIFLDTADYVVVTSQTQALIPELVTYLRPACRLCLETGAADLTAVAGYLDTHEPQVTLMKYLQEGKELPLLVTKEGRMELVSQ